MYENYFIKTFQSIIQLRVPKNNAEEINKRNIYVVFWGLLLKKRLASEDINEIKNRVKAP